MHVDMMVPNKRGRDRITSRLEKCKIKNMIFNMDF